MGVQTGRTTIKVHELERLPEVVTVWHDGGMKHRVHGDLRERAAAVAAGMARSEVARA